MNSYLALQIMKTSPQVITKLHVLHILLNTEMYGGTYQSSQETIIGK